MGAIGPTAYASGITLVTTTLTTAVTGIAPPGGTFIPDGISNSNLATFPNVFVEGHINITGGTGTTSFTVTCLDDSGNAVSSGISGTLAGTNSAGFPFVFKDGSGIEKGSYKVQVQLTGATANGAVNRISANCRVG